MLTLDGSRTHCHVQRKATTIPHSLGKRQRFHKMFLASWKVKLKVLEPLEMLCSSQTGTQDINAAALPSSGVPPAIPHGWVPS